MSLKIDHSGQNQTLGLELQPTVERKEADFGKTLAQTGKLQGHDLELFIKNLDIQGKKLAESMSIEDLFNFKNMVRNFLKTTFGRSRTMQEETVWNYSGQPKAMSRVTKIDRALEKLGEQILSSQAEPLKILAKIDEIKGLIIDLFA